MFTLLPFVDRTVEVPLCNLANGRARGERERLERRLIYVNAKPPLSMPRKRCS